MYKKRNKQTNKKRHLCIGSNYSLIIIDLYFFFLFNKRYGDVN